MDLIEQIKQNARENKQRIVLPEGDEERTIKAAEYDIDYNDNFMIDEYEITINNEFITKEQYNLNVVSEMIKEVYDVCSKNNVLFGVSPDGNMENNYEKVFADVKRWCGNTGYIDFIMPQVYYGFYNEVKPFKMVVDEWEGIITNDKIKLYIALAFYKVGEVDKYAKSGKEEWVNNSDIIMREILMSRNLNKYEGFSLFRYDYIFNDSKYNAISTIEIENVKKILN